MFTSPVLVGVGTRPYQTMFGSTVGVSVRPCDGTPDDIKAVWEQGDKIVRDDFRLRVLSCIPGIAHVADLNTLPLSIERLLFQACIDEGSLSVFKKWWSYITSMLSRVCGGKPPVNVICSTITKMYSHSMTILVRENSVLRAYRFFAEQYSDMCVIYKQPLVFIPPLMQSYADAQHAKLLDKLLIPDIVKYISSFLYVDPVSAAYAAIKQRETVATEISYNCIDCEDRDVIIEKDDNTGIVISHRCNEDCPCRIRPE